MANFLDKLVEIMSADEIKNFISGKTSPTIKTDNKVSVDTETLKTAGMYILGGFITSALLIGGIIVIGIRWSLKPLYKQDY